MRIYEKSVSFVTEKIIPFCVPAIAAASLALFLHLPCALAGGEISATGETHSENTISTEESEFNPGAWLVSLFRDHITAVDGNRCPSTPSCASYSYRAFRKHGFFAGWLMTVDRLIHEGGEETAVSPLTYHHGSIKILDPVANNDFWWFHRPGRENN
jgi:hypothetical protein